MRAPDCVFVWTFREAVSLALGDVDMRTQIGSTHLLAGTLESRINFKELGFADPLCWPTPLSSIMRVDKIFHGSPGLNDLSAANAGPSQSGDMMWPADRTILLLGRDRFLHHNEQDCVMSRMDGIHELWLCENVTISSPLRNVCSAREVFMP